MKRDINRIMANIDLTANERKNKWLHMVSNTEGDAPININQDAHIYSLELDKNNEIRFFVKTRTTSLLSANRRNINY